VATNARWRDIICQEINALKDNEIWETVDIPPNKKALGCKWLFKKKYISDGHVECYKAHLVTFGNHQIAGIEFIDTFALMVKMVMVQIFLVVVAAKQWNYIKWMCAMLSYMVI